MRQKTLLFISLLILNSSLALAEEQSHLPALPSTDIGSPAPTPTDDSQSFLGRIKNLFGFKNKEKSADTEKLDNKIKEPESKTPISEAVSDSILSDNNKISGQDISSLTQEGLHVLSEKSKLNLPEDSSQLKLPSGFDENLQANEAPEKLTVVNEGAANTSPASQEDLDSAITNKNNKTLENENLDAAHNLPQLSLPEPSKSDSSPKTEPILDTNNKVGVATPIYASETNISKGPETTISQYIRELDSKKKTPESVETITAEELEAKSTAKPERFTEVTSANIDPAQLKFVNNEAQVLILPNDDITLGVLTEEAYYDSIDFKSYTKLFWSEYEKLKSEPQRIVIENFIKNYDKNFNEGQDIFYNDEIIMGLNQALKSIDQNNINSLIDILNSYPILQVSDQNKNTLLHKASYAGNYAAARLLILKGIDIFAKNANNQTPLSIAEKFNRQHIIFLIKSSALK